jgi:hypothetical protein
MNIADLKKIIADMPDDALVVVAGNHGTCSEARAEAGFATEPNPTGFCEWLEDPPQDRGFDTSALYVTKLHFS